MPSSKGIIALDIRYMIAIVKKEFIANITYIILKNNRFTLKYPPIPPSTPEKTLLFLERVSFLIGISSFISNHIVSNYENYWNTYNKFIHKET